MSGVRAPDWLDLDFRADCWRVAHQGPSLKLFFRGYLYGTGLTDLAGHLVDAEKGGRHWSEASLDRLHGHFALLAVSPDRVLLAADRVRSLPLEFGRSGKHWIVGDVPGSVADRMGLGVVDVDPGGALALAMSSSTVGPDTLYRPLEVLRPGEAALLTPDGRRRWRYHGFYPWNVADRPVEELERELERTTLEILERLARSVEGRPIVIPISGGMDFRLIASGLRHLGYKDVLCYTYGIPGNQEARAAEAVATKLGYEWTFVRYTVRSQRQWFRSDDHRAYLAFADTCTTTPFEGDLPAIRALEDRGWLPEDAVIVNGQTGNFISGNHILAPLHDPPKDAGAGKLERLVLDTTLERHFRLWDVLARPENDERIEELLRAQIREAGGHLDDPDRIHGVFESCEFENCQTKYVIGGQRIYDYAGYEWRLPLWDRAYLDFWEQAPRRAKIDQRLYRDVLMEADWGGVWRDESLWWRRRTAPLWRVGPRYVLHRIFDLVAPEAWSRFDRQVFGHLKRNTLGMANWPYRRVLLDSRGFRNAVSWWTERHLASRGLAFDGTPREADA